MICTTYNIRLGIQQGLDAIAQAAMACGRSPDLLAIQEVGSAWTMGPPGDTTATLASALSLPHAHYVPAILAGDARYGHALLSRYPLTALEHVALTRLEDEPRVLLHARVDAPEGPIHLLTTHLSWLEQDRPAQGAQLVERALALDADGAHVIIMGDLNEHDAPWLSALRARFADADAAMQRLTYPAHAPRLRLDYLWTNQGQWGEVCVGPDAEASDHLALSARWSR